MVPDVQDQEYWRLETMISELREGIAWNPYLIQPEIINVDGLRYS